MSIYKREGNYWINIRHNGRRYRKASPDNSSAGAKVYESLLRQKLAKEGVLAFKPEKKKEERMDHSSDFPITPEL